MSTRLPALLMVAIPFGLAPALALAGECSDVPLTPEQEAFLAETGISITTPAGEVPDIQRCDIDRNNIVDINDIRAIAAVRGQPAAHPDDPMDWDRNFLIDVRDARGCQQACTLQRCRTPVEEPEVLVGGTTEAAECNQSEDISGDGKPDVVAISKYTGQQPRGGNWELETVILTEDEAGNPQAVTFPYTGKQAGDGAEVQQHLSTQPAGTVDLRPGTLMLTEPAIVSYRNGEPKVIYYYENGQLARAFYGVDD